MTPEQLQSLMSWVIFAARYQTLLPIPNNTNECWDNYLAARKNMYAEFGLVEGEDGWPIKPQHRDTLPPVNLATSDPEGHRQAIADADYDAIHTLLAKNDPSLPLADAEEIMRLWPELKAIMEPGSLCADQLAELGGNNDTK